MYAFDKYFKISFWCSKLNRKKLVYKISLQEFNMFLFVPEVESVECSHTTELT